jgi:type IV pilus assembly protein PilM
MFFSNWFSNKSILGIDIGTSNIKIAQVTHKDKVPFLDTYGIVNTPYRLSDSSNAETIEHVAKILKTLMNRAQVSTHRCVISFPNSAVFTSVISLPKMNPAELNPVVEFEAKKYVPLALHEIDLSWTIISGENPAESKYKILLTAVPKQITQNYMRMFSLAGLEPEIGEIEALALIRSLIGNHSTNCVIIDIGAKSTGLNIVDQGYLKLSRNLSIGGDTITMKIAQSLNVSTFRAEQFKKDFGVSSATFIPDAIRPVLNIIKDEVRQFLNIYRSQNSQVDKIILAGGGANLPGIVNFFEDLNAKVEVANPIKAVAYDKSLEPVLKRYSLSLPVAIGLALRKK